MELKQGTKLWYIDKKTGEEKMGVILQMGAAEFKFKYDNKTCIVPMDYFEKRFKEGKIGPMKYEAPKLEIKKDRDSCKSYMNEECGGLHCEGCNEYQPRQVLDSDETGGWPKFGTATYLTELRSGRN